MITDVIERLHARIEKQEEMLTQLQARNAVPERAAEPEFARSIREVISEESKGGAACGWKPCTGCHETNEGVSVGHYQNSRVFGCEVGSGCSECGGLGVVWEYWSAKNLADYAASMRPAPKGGAA